MKEQILRNLIRESIKKMISESKTLKEYSGDSGLEELAETLGYSDVIEFFEDNSGAVDAVYKWVESIPALKQKMQQSGTNYMHDPEFQKSQAAFVAGVKSADKSITTQQSTKIAEKFAQYMSNKENKKFTVTKNSVEGPSFDLDLNGEEYDGGSYIIDTKGDIVNVALSKPEVYGNISMLESNLKEANNLSPAGKADMHAKDIIKNYMQGGTVKDIQSVIKRQGLKGTALVNWIVDDMETAEQEFGDGAIVTKKNYDAWIYEPDKVKDAAMKKAAKMIVANIDKYLSLKEGDMTRQYDGFIVLDVKDQKIYKFRYIKGVNNVTAENDAIAKVMRKTGKPRAAFMVHGSIKKGEWDKSDVPTLESVNKSTNVMETKIKEAGGRRFIKSENIRQYNASKIKEANKKK